MSNNCTVEIELDEETMQRFFKRWIHRQLYSTLFFQKYGQSLKTYTIYTMIEIDIFEKLEVSA